MKRLNISPTEDTTSSIPKFNVLFPWDKPSRAFMPVSTVAYDLPESTTVSYQRPNAKLRLADGQQVTTVVSRLDTFPVTSSLPGDEMKSTTSRTVGNTNNNRSRAIGVEVITRRSFDIADANILKNQAVISNSPRFVPIKPDATSVTVKLGINLKVNPKTSPKKQEERDKELNVEIAQAYTVFGEPCRDTCSNRGYSYTWCHKKVSSEVGTWTDSDYCTITPNITHFGEHCTDLCEERGESYYWCHKDTSLWGYCTPKKLYKKTVSPIRKLVNIV